jgi:APA family basic amino acid/polyamine antiporter
MSQDGLLWKWASRVHPRFHTPYISTAAVGVAVAVLASLVPLTTLASLTSIATLFAFVVVCAGVWILRVREPNLARPFRTPWVPFVPIMGMGIAFTLMLSSGAITWELFLSWLVLGLLVYFFYSRHNSKVQHGLTPGR